MKRTLFVLLAAVVCLPISVSVSQAITIDPDYLPGGAVPGYYQNIANAYASLGVTMRAHFSGQGWYPNVYSSVPYNSTSHPGRASTGTRVFSIDEPFASWASDVASGSGGIFAGDRLEINFTSSAGYVSLDFLPLVLNQNFTNTRGTAPAHEGLLYVYGESGLMKTVTVPNDFNVCRVAVVGSHITKVIATAKGHPELYHPESKVFLDNLQYHISTGGMLITLDGTSPLHTTTGFSLENGATINGSGAVEGSLLNTSGLIDPGLSPGTILVNGDYSQLAEGRLRIELGEEGHDLLDVQGAVSLSGLLEVVLQEGFSPADGQAYEIVDFLSHVGGFSAVTGLNFAGGHFDLDFRVGDGLYLVASLDSVPVPPSALLLGSGLLMAVPLLRRRKNRNG